MYAGRSSTKKSDFSMTKNGISVPNDDLVLQESQSAEVVCEPPDDIPEAPVTPTEKKSNLYRYQSESISEAGMEHVMSEGNFGIEKQIAVTTQKLTVLKINQLLRKTRKLLATHQESPEEIKMEIGGFNWPATSEEVNADHDDVFADTCDK